jgi:D-alanine-D-alanine ligase
MPSPDRIVVLYGGLGAEREVSLQSGAAICDALATQFKVEALRLDTADLPASIDPDAVVVFPALHGTFGEDGGLQQAMDAVGIEYCGSNAEASQLCMAKDQTKAVARTLGIAVPAGICFSGTQVPPADTLIEALGHSLVVKPNDMGSSVGLYFTEHRSELGVRLSQIHSGNWIVEERIRGRELTVGILHGKAMGIVEVVSPTGVYDFAAKYTTGTTDYQYPAKLDPAMTARIQSQAEQLFSACGCRDFARIDFLLADEVPYFLEINTLPGLTATSLLPKSASCVGYDFEGLAAELVRAAMQRFSERKQSVVD